MIYNQIHKKKKLEIEKILVEKFKIILLSKKNTSIWKIYKNYLKTWKIIQLF